jgi:small subunit ribosomal protein S5
VKTVENTKDARKEASSKNEYVETVLEVRRVTKVIKGGRRLAFSALVVVGDGKGRVGIASSKSREYAGAVSKALKRARKEMFSVPFYKTTIPYPVEAKHGASKVLLRSASKGTGVIAGGAVRHLLEALGVKDVLAKSLGAPNNHNVAKATVVALQKLRHAGDIARLRDKSLNEMFGNKSDAETTQA